MANALQTMMDKEPKNQFVLSIKSSNLFFINLNFFAFSCLSLNLQYDHLDSTSKFQKKINFFLNYKFHIVKSF